jgi:hypothetical protein
MCHNTAKKRKEKPIIIIIQPRRQDLYTVAAFFLLVSYDLKQAGGREFCGNKILKRLFMYTYISACARITTHLYFLKPDFL